MIEVTITRQMLDTDLQSWFLNAKNAEHAKEEILALFAQFASTDCPFQMNGAGSSVEAV